MADVKETLVKEAIRRAEEEAARKNKEVQGVFGGDGNAGTKDGKAQKGGKGNGGIVIEDGDAENKVKKANAGTDNKGTEDAGAKTDENDDISAGTDKEDAGAENAGTDNESTDENADTENESTDIDAGNSDESEEDQETGSDTAGDSTETGKVRKKTSIFGKKNKKDPRDEKIEELNDRLLRNLAEFENFRKRTEKEKSQMFEIGAKSIIEKILPAIDSFERGLATIGEADKGSPLAEGMEKIYKQLIGSLEEAGLKHIEAVGQEFDPNLHNAVMHEDNDELGENVVSEEFQKGYMYRDSIVRHSMVKVAN